jgi:tRNA (uracil-5-)-methyltransferase TRM9
VDQDDSSKRDVPSSLSSDSCHGVDAFVPWVLNSSKLNSGSPHQPDRPVFNRFYHLFAVGELRQLACEAAESLGMIVGPPSPDELGQRGLEVVRDDYEKSNWFVELRLWATKDTKEVYI